MHAASAASILLIGNGTAVPENKNPRGRVAAGALQARHKEV
jgi:hypothetical protein